MYFSPRGKDLREQKMLEFATAQKMLELSLNKKNLAVFFEKYKIKKVAIAPNNHFAQALIKMTRSDELEVFCFCDRMYERYRNGIMGIPVIGYEALEERAVDAVIVTSVYYGNDIIDSLLEHHVPLEKIIGINTILYEMGCR